jgi:hypothetical protein
MIPESDSNPAPECRLGRWVKGKFHYDFERLADSLWHDVEAAPAGPPYRLYSTYICTSEEAALTLMRCLQDAGFRSVEKVWFEGDSRFRHKPETTPPESEPLTDAPDIVFLEGPPAWWVNATSSAVTTRTQLNSLVMTFRELDPDSRWHFRSWGIGP